MAWFPMLAHCYILNDINLSKGIYMKNTCRHCHADSSNSEYFQKLYCSIKCKILKDVTKLDTGCWLYKSSTAGDYSKIRWNAKWYQAHRLSYKIFKEDIPKGMLVCHTCDVMKCINPDHLFLGTHKDNAIDRMKKGRGLTGEKNHFAKITNAQAKELIALSDEGFHDSRLSRIFNISRRHIRKIKNITRSNYGLVPK